MNCIVCGKEIEHSQYSNHVLCSGQCFCIQFWKDIIAEADVTVYSIEYGLTETFHFVGRDAVDCKNLREGEAIEATLNSWVLDSTGEVQRREIGSIDP